MGLPIRGDVVVLPFPYSDLSGSKKRPAVVLSELMGADLILCQVTSKNNSDPFSVPISSQDFLAGSIRDPSLVRPNKLFTFEAGLILYTLGHLRQEKLDEIITMAIKAIQ